MSKIAFDIGGNGVQYLVADKISSFSTIGKNKEFVLSKMAQIINDNKITEVGISSPCGVDTVSGQLYGISGIKDYENFNLYSELNEKLDNKQTKIIAANDANAALLGNLIGEDINSAAQVTIGTGIGGAIFSEGNVLTNKLAMAGEFGYIPFRNEQNTSEVCSANALVKRINDKYKKEYKNFLEVDSKHYSEYNEVIEAWAKDVSSLLIQIFFTIAPEKLFISGGIVKNEFIKEKIQYMFTKTLKDFKYSFDFKIIFKNIDNAALHGMMAQL